MPREKQTLTSKDVGVVSASKVAGPRMKGTIRTGRRRSGPRRTVSRDGAPFNEFELTQLLLAGPQAIAGRIAVLKRRLALPRFEHKRDSYAAKLEQLTALLEVKLPTGS